PLSDLPLRALSAWLGRNEPLNGAGGPATAGTVLGGAMPTAALSSKMTLSKFEPGRNWIWPAKPGPCGLRSESTTVVPAGAVRGMRRSLAGGWCRARPPRRLLMTWRAGTEAMLMVEFATPGVRTLLAMVASGMARFSGWALAVCTSEPVA